MVVLVQQVFKLIYTNIENLYSQPVFLDRELNTVSFILTKCDTVTKSNRFYPKQLWEKIIEKLDFSKTGYLGPEVNGRVNFETATFFLKKLELKNNLIYATVKFFKEDFALLAMRNNKNIDVYYSGNGGLTTINKIDFVNDNYIFNTLTFDLINEK